MPVRNVIFDWSGTLADDFRPVLEATNEIFRHYGLAAWTAAEFRERFYMPFPEFFREFLPQATLPEIDFHYHRAFRSLQEEIPLLPGAVEILEHCRSAGMKVFLLSSIHPEHWAAQSARLGVGGYFTKAYAGALDKRRTILALLAEWDLNPAETMFVGDMRHDIDTAKHGRVVSCAVLTGYDSLEKLKKSEPDLLFRDLAGVLGHLRRHTTEPEGAPVATVGALLFNEAGDVLMIRTHKWSDRWGIPGGKIKRGETAEAALRREVLEETGLEIEDVRWAQVQDCIDCPEFYKRVHFLLLNYTARAVGTRVVLNDEAETHRWMAPRAALAELELNTPTRVLLESVLAAGGGA